MAGSAGTTGAFGSAVVRACLPVTFLVLALSSDAHALKPAVHADLSQKACRAAGLPDAFCRRIATENYNTDAREWDDLSAHAQIDDGETACTAADRTLQRVWQLGQELHVELASLRQHVDDDAVGRTAALVGRALHTIQDNCAHHGMPNPQHAWFSLGDFCDGTDTSPDVQPEAVACARVETEAAIAMVAKAVREAGVASALARHSCPPSPSSDQPQQREVCDSRFLPAPWDACEFLGGAKDWDGIDRQWNNQTVVPRLRAELAAGLASTSATDDVCGGDERVLAAAVSAPTVDVSGGTPSCARVHVMCLGGADGDDNPFADDPIVDDVGGCGVGGASPRGLAALVAFALAFALRRRRRG